MELQTAKATYLEQIRVLERKIAQDRSTLQEQRRMIGEARKRREEVKRMNFEIEANILSEHSILRRKLQHLDGCIRQNLVGLLLASSERSTKRGKKADSSRKYSTCRR